MSEILSALSDGQATPEEVARAAAAWRDDAQARATWHRYHLIGDALRSPESLQTSDGAAFLQGFRARLAQEPVVLAPQAPQTSHHDLPAAADLASLKRRPWAGPAAVAASFLLLVGLMASNLEGVGRGASDGRDGTLALSPVSSWQGMEAGGVVSSLGPSRRVRLESTQGMGASFDNADQTEGVLIRDPRVEPVLSLQRPMVIDPAAASFSSAGPEPGLLRQVGYSAP